MVMLQGNNASPHKARIILQFKENTGIRFLYWPAKSPDLNSIEIVWDVMGKGIKKSNSLPS